MSRILLILCMLVAMPFTAGTAHANEAEDARAFVDSVGQRVLNVINASQNEQQKQQELRQMFSQHVDMDWMARFVLGSTWKSASEEQRKAYVEAYREYLLQRYTNNFAEYAGSKYTITGVKSEADGQYTVGMNVDAPNASDQEVRAGYRVRAENGEYRIVDIIIEGVSLITTQRSEFASVVKKDGMDKLISQLNAKAQTRTS